MKHFIHSAIVTVCGFVGFVSCAEQEADLLSDNQSSSNQLRVVTHTREGEGASTPIASVYLFNSSNEFVRTLQTDATSYTSASASAKLLEGTYTLCALSPSDLSHFLLPDPLTPTSAITLASGQTMSDLLMATASVTLQDGDNEVVDMTLQRKVLELSSGTITQVPDDVSGVTVSIAPFYSAIQFNGSYLDANPSTCTFTLSKNTDTGNWEAAPHQLAFPSKGIPTITVTFSYSESDTNSYTFTAESALIANNKYIISGAYTEPLGVTIVGSITLQPWATDPTEINFDFDENNAASNSTPNPSTEGDDPSSGNDTPDSGSGGSGTTDSPVAGQTYKGCYVVSVNPEAKTAVLISPIEIRDLHQGSGWMNTLENVLASWEVEGVSGTWRIPTLAEFEELAPFPDSYNLNMGSYKEYFCLVDSDLKMVQIKRKPENVGGYIEVKSDQISAAYGASTYLKPVIDISYE